MTKRLYLVAGAAAVVFVLAHAGGLPVTLEDHDSVNFALAVERFDVADHRPHPPGYPVFVAASKTSTQLFGRLRPDWDRDRTAAVGLAFWSVLAGAAGVWILIRFWVASGQDDRTAVLAALLAVASPLFWFTAVRPLSDVSGLVLAVIVQGGLIAGLAEQRRDPSRLPGVWIWAAAGAGLAIGWRSQTMWLTGPLLMWAVAAVLRQGQWRRAAVILGVAATGALLWAVPLVWLSGGPAGYFAALASQANQDFSGVEMLATQPSSALLRASLSSTFVDAWVAGGLARSLMALAMLGAVRLLWRDRRQLATIGVAFVPYLLFHLAFHQQAELRYSLPLVVPVAGLAVIGAGTFGRVVAVALVSLGIAVSLAHGQPAVAANAGGAPVFNALRILEARAERDPDPPLIRQHHQAWWATRRALDWYASQGVLGPLPFPGDRETRAVAALWLEGRQGPVWFLASPTRTDLARFDRRALRLAGNFLPSPAVRALTGRARQDGVSLWEIDRPDWILGRGWTVTLELSGQSAADGHDRRTQPARAFVRRTSRPLKLLVGGYHYRDAGGLSQARLQVAIDGDVRDEWLTTPGAFVRWIDLPAGVPNGPDPYALLHVLGAPAGDGLEPPNITLNQFDVVEEDEVALALTEGWFLPEADPITGRTWRWTGGSATVQLSPATTDVRMIVSGESTRRYFGRAATVRLMCGDDEVASFEASDDFTRTFDLPRTMLAAADWTVRLTTDATFQPARVSGSPDERDLGLRVFGIAVEPIR